MAGPVFADGDVPTGSNFNDYLGAKGLLTTKRTTSGDSGFADNNNQNLIDTIDNITIGGGCTANRAIKLTWVVVGTIGGTAQHTFEAKAYYKAASSFGTVSGATVFFVGTFRWDWSNFVDSMQTPVFVTSLAPATVYSFGLAIQRVAGSGFTYTVRGSSTLPRLAIVEDIGLGTRVV